MITINRPDTDTTIYLRKGTSDEEVYQQIFVKEDYKKQFHAIQTIIDAGANIGLSSLYLAQKYPEATIYAIEPDENDFRVLIKNTRRYNNIVPIFGALWNKDCEISLIDGGNGDWSFITDPTKKGDIPAYTVTSIMKSHNITSIDLFKIDIEGAEIEVFNSSEEWIDKVSNIIVELHEWIRPGCKRAFYSATHKFSKQSKSGENIILQR